MSYIKLNIKSFGFTLVELLVGIAILGIVTAIALPNLNTFLVKTRVDNEISKIYRLALVARNTAISTGKSVTLCPLDEDNECNQGWQNELSVFTNDSDNTKFENVEKLVKIKAQAPNDDTLKFNQNIIVFLPTGRLSSGSNSQFSYCPKGYASLSRSVNISLSGRVYSSSDPDNSGRDKNRNGNFITCT